MSAPEHLSELAASVWDDVEAAFTAAGDSFERLLTSDIEAYCVQVARMRDAQTRVDKEGLVIADEKGRPVAHPAIAIERAAQAEVRAWKDRFTPRRRRPMTGRS